MTSQSGVAAPMNDLTLIKTLLEYNKINPAISKATVEKFRSHLWYLSDELTGHALFDKAVLITIKRLMVTALKQVGTDSSSKRFCPDL